MLEGFMRVPLVRQSGAHNCGEAVVESILRHYHQPVRAVRFSSEVDGTAPRTVEHQLRRHGFSVIAGNFTWATLRYHVRRKTPCIVCRDGHWVIVTALESRSVIIMDPLADDYVRESIVRFRRTWTDYDTMATEYRSWAIVPDPMHY